MTRLWADQADCSRDRLLELEDLVKRGECGAGFFQVERPLSCDVLLLFNKTIHSAVRFQQQRATPLSVASFFGDFTLAPTQRALLYESDPGAVLLAALVFQNSPSTRVAAKLANLEQVLDDLAAEARNAAILLRRGPAHNLVYCREGRPLAAFFVNPTELAVDCSVREQILFYAYAAPAETEVAVFHGLQSRRDEHAGRSFAELLQGRLGPPSFLLSVRNRGERVQRRLIQAGKATIGRDPANDLVIDHLSISREHCAVEWSGRQFLVRDCGSANGTWLAGRRVQESTLRLGDRITAGDFEILFSDEDGLAFEGALETVFLEPPTGPVVAHLLFKDQVIPLTSTVFTIGKKAGSSLRLKGLFMKPIQATIVREGEESFRLLAVSGGQRVRLNQSPVPNGGQILTTGSEILVGKHALVFVVSDGGAGPAKSPSK